MKIGVFFVRTFSFVRVKHFDAIIKYKQIVMSSSDITKKRLNSLKALTEELRDRTKNAPLDLSHIKELLSNTRQLHTSQAHRPPVPDASENLATDSRPFLSEKSRGMDCEQEVVMLRQENIGLQHKISQLKEQIGRLQADKQKLEAAAQGSSKHFFKISDSLQAFVGRLAIAADNYDRLEYSAYEIELGLDKVVLLKKEKGAIQEFQLTGLRGVDYCGSNVMVLRFEEFLQESSLHPLTTVFLKFYSEDHLRRWDLALYANYHIVNSLEQKRLFEKYFRCLKMDQEAQAQKERIKSIRQSVDLDQNKEKDLLKLLLKKRQQLLEVKQLIHQKLEHKIQAKIALSKEEKELVGEQPEELEKPKQQVLHKRNSNSNIGGPIEKIEQLQAHQQESEKFVQPIIAPEPSIHSSQSQHHQHHPFKIRHTDSNMINSYNQPIYSSPDPRTSKIMPISQLNNSSVRQGTFPLSPPPFVPGRSQLRDSKATLVNQLNNNEVRGQSVESSHNNSIAKFNDAKQERLHAARVRLQNGYYATKYSKDGFNPHDKKVFLSLDSKKLCWSDRDKQAEYKSVPIAVLIGVEYGVVGEGVTKHVKNPDARYFCVIEYYASDYKKKTIELGSGNMQDIKDLSLQLSIIISNRQVTN